ncbi:dTDP-4-dehydrorhamnose reductase [Calidifontibacter terrae]
MWVLLGGTGMLGQDLHGVLRSEGTRVTALSSVDCDIRDPDAVRAALDGATVVVNCAAWTAVDAAEEHEAEAFALNAVGARNAAIAAREVGARFVHISTDYVFDGHGEGPYLETAAQSPQSAYGRTKVAGEWAVRSVDPDAYVVRTAWLYGAGGKNFVKTMLRLAEERDILKVVADQVGQPTWTGDLANLIVRLVTSGAPGGYYHGTSAGETSWHGFANEVFSLTGLDPERIQPISTADFPTPAARPANSVLGHDAFAAIGVEPIGHWGDRLRLALDVMSTER